MFKDLVNSMCEILSPACDQQTVTTVVIIVVIIEIIKVSSVGLWSAVFLD